MPGSILCGMNPISKTHGFINKIHLLVKHMDL